jgi:hypothetical protein
MTDMKKTYVRLSAYNCNEIVSASFETTEVDLTTHDFDLYCSCPSGGPTWSPTVGEEDTP